MPYVGRPPDTGPYLKLDDISDEFDGSKVTFNITLGGSGGGALVVERVRQVEMQLLLLVPVEEELLARLDQVVLVSLSSDT
jgi:hypothetical protein